MSRGGPESVDLWLNVAQRVLDDALEAALSAFGGTDGGVGRAVDNLSRYYDPDSDYAGLLFLSRSHDDPDAISPADLFAITTLNVGVSRYTARRLTGPGATSREIKGALDDVKVERTLATVHVDLSGGDDVLLAAMERLHLAVRTGIAPAGREATSRRWVTASKLCARKRPALFPIRDNVVCGLLGTRRLNSYIVDWRVFHHLITTPQIRRAIQTASDEVHHRHHGRAPDHEELRILDAVLWMHGMSRT